MAPTAMEIRSHKSMTNFAGHRAGNKTSDKNMKRREEKRIVIF